MPHSTSYDVVVLGAGAAGMMCAFEAGRRGRRVLLLDHADRVGRKILISGGGRCNFTNLHTRAENFLSANPHFAKSALARFTQANMIALVEKHGISYHEKTLGQMFCDGSARQIVAMLGRECAEAGVETRCGVTVRAVRRAEASGTAGLSAASAKPPHSGEDRPIGTPVNADSGRDDRFLDGRDDRLRGARDQRFTVETTAGNFSCASLVVATGGLSIPKMGATGFGYELARQFGHAVIEPRAGLVPLVFSAGDRERWCDLAGVAFEVVAKAARGAAADEKQVLRSAQDDNSKGKKGDRPKVKFRERLLVTHRGLSGPAVLQVSSFWRPGEEVSFDLAPGCEVLAPLLTTNAPRDAASLLAALRGVLPARMAERWAHLHVISKKPDWTNAGVARMERDLHAWTLRPDGSEGFAKAEVTVGGVDTRELDARTMESRRVPGLHFIGEVVDVTGWLGGYNFQWAWASAVAAGREL